MENTSIGETTDKLDMQLLSGDKATNQCIPSPNPENIDNNDNTNMHVRMAVKDALPHLGDDKANKHYISIKPTTMKKRSQHTYVPHSLI